MKFLFSIFLFLSSAVNALDLTLGLGTCSNAVDYCPRPVGKIALSQTLWQEDKHSIDLSIEHYSKIGNGEWRWEGDRGTEFYLLEYKVKLR